MGLVQFTRHRSGDGMVGLQGTWSQLWDSDTRLASPANHGHTASTQTIFDDAQNREYILILIIILAENSK